MRQSILVLRVPVRRPPSSPLPQSRLNQLQSKQHHRFLSKRWNTTEQQQQQAHQRRAYEYYQKKEESSKWFFSSKPKKAKQRVTPQSREQRSVQMAWYGVAVAVGTLGATYASVPLYKMFCQATGFGGTTQRVTLTEWAEKQSEREETGVPLLVQNLLKPLMDKVPDSIKQNMGKNTRIHTWTDEDAAARLASLQPVANGRLVTVRFDSTVGDVLPWTFVPTQLDVKVVPGETALSFFTVTNKSDKAITGVATYNVYPPKAGLYFNKIQCFCFEEQRLLPGETVDMPVFFFIDPDFAQDPQLTHVNNITLSYTFFQTDEEDDDDDDDDDDDNDDSS